MRYAPRARLSVAPRQCVLLTTDCFTPSRVAMPWSSIADPVTQWAFMILVSVVLGTCLLIAVAFFRRWQQIRYVSLRSCAPASIPARLATLLSGAPEPLGIEALRELPLADVETPA